MKFAARIVEHSTFSKTNSAFLAYLHPRFWLVWLGIALLRITTWLPWRVQTVIARILGNMLYFLLKKRRQISCINLKLAFPELTPKARRQLNRKHFISLVQGFFEAALSWWGNTDKLKHRIRIEGKTYLNNALAKGNGVLLLSAHFTSLELGGRLLTIAFPDLPLHVVYRPHQNRLIESLIARIRADRYGKAIPKQNIREMLKSLRAGFPLWYAQDQSYQGKNSVIVPFFNVPTPTNSATSRFARLSGASVIPFFTVRDDTDGYLLRFLPPLENFPSADINADTRRINKLIETQVREYPEQYLWTHKRFKQPDRDIYNPPQADGECL